MLNQKFHPEYYLRAIEDSPFKDKLIERIVYTQEEKSITYRADAIYVDPKAPDFQGNTTNLNDEELVRAVLLLRLSQDYGYPLDGKSICLETVYEAPGRPIKGSKGSRADVIIRDPKGNPFLFFELKTPDNYVRERDFIKGQLFQGSKLDIARPKFLVWATVREAPKTEKIDVMVIPAEKYPEYTEWREAGEPCGNTIPYCYSHRTKRMYAKVQHDDRQYKQLDETSDTLFFRKLANDLHDVIWDGGGTNNNDVFAVITRLFLCKIYDEKETRPGEEYTFQTGMQDSSEESAEKVLARLNALYRKAEISYLAVESTQNIAFDKARIRPSKILYVVRRIEGISLTKNVFQGDLLGTFFEEIVSHGFTQTRGQFFTPVQLIHFMLALCDVSGQAKRILQQEPDGRGIHRLPNVIDPSCGVGSFLISYMQRITEDLYDDVAFRRNLSDRAREEFEAKFAGPTHTFWAKTSLYGIENNYDLGLAAKVNMILHGDGSMSTFITSGLLPFDSYHIKDRPTALEVKSPLDARMNEQFDLVLSNPPFSISFSADDREELKKIFSGELGLSEDLFIERWDQLLRPGTGMFCCILPESVCSVDVERKTRLFLLLRYKIRAVISLPYSTFKPYTHVKTCIIFAQKRTREETERLCAAANGLLSVPAHHALIQKLVEEGIGEEKIFFAEPHEIGYKRRKGLPDLERPNDLLRIQDHYRALEDGRTFEESLQFGFTSAVSEILKQTTMRLDAKNRWLWDKLDGKINVSNGSDYWCLSEKFQEITLHILRAGPLSKEAKLIELDDVRAAGEGIEEQQVPTVGAIDADKVSLAGADFVMPRLRTEMGKFIMRPDADMIGSKEFAGLKVRNGMTPMLANYMFCLPEFQEAIRMLQTGKQHPRIKIAELLKLKTNIDLGKVSESNIFMMRAKIEEQRKLIENQRKLIDEQFRQSNRGCDSVSHHV